MQLLIQLGPETTSDPDLIISLFRRYGYAEPAPPREAQVVEIISTLARYASEGAALPDVGALVRALARFVRNFMEGAGDNLEALKGYVRAVKQREYPGPEHCF